MTIPTYQQVMEPLLHLATDNAEHTVREAVEQLSSTFDLDAAEVAELLSSGTPVFASRVGWAATYLRKAGLLQSTRRGYFRITQRGKAALQEEAAETNTEYLKRFSEFVAFQARTSDTTLLSPRMNVPALNRRPKMPLRALTKLFARS